MQALMTLKFKKKIDDYEKYCIQQQKFCGAKKATNDPVVEPATADKLEPLTCRQYYGVIVK